MPPNLAVSIWFMDLKSVNQPAFEMRVFPKNGENQPPPFRWYGAFWDSSKLRRGYPAFHRAELVRVLEPLVAAKAKERQATSTGGVNPQLRENSREAEKGRTDETLAQIAGISTNTIRRAKVIEDGIPITG